jgi:hypothetical protein
MRPERPVTEIFMGEGFDRNRVLSRAQEKESH